ncbi:tyrosine-type recombinase/integrase [Acidiferrimicrobium sp. IK]|uniref:tyrosine-type recombinase/integrase n=1 Tax=Acidiferrimicrobium sp. IK TaxID=2871700 RepID=UPI0021CB5F53|nr:tyrosine-type recombinase/integrase [Acidiferrimicrobium sp. IK]
MGLKVVVVDGGHRLGGGGPVDDLANRYLGHLAVRRFSPGTVRGYAFDLLNFSRFLAERRLALGEVRASDLFDWLEWQAQRPPGGKVIQLGAARGPAPATINRRVAAVRGLFEYAVIVGEVEVSPVPAARRATGWRAPRRGMLAHVGPGRPRGGGRLVRQSRRLPESVDLADVGAFIADLATHRDRSIALVMVLGGLRAGEVRSLLLADVDMGLGRVRVVGKGGRERVVPVDRAFFAETAAYLAGERPAGCSTPQCFVVLRGPTAGGAMTEAGLRKIFRSHRVTSGAPRVRPHRLRHTYGTELAAAGVDLLVLRELMGHVSPETTAGYVHLSADAIAAEYAAVRARAAR